MNYEKKLILLVIQIAILLTFVSVQGDCGSGSGGLITKPGNSWKTGGGAVFSGGLVAPDVVIPNPSTTTDLLSATTSTDLAKQPKANAHKPLISSKRFAHRKAVPPANL